MQQFLMNLLLKSWRCDTALNVMKFERVGIRIVFGLKLVQDPGAFPDLPVSVKRGESIC